MWTDSLILRFTLLSALIGLISFCACYSYLVWRKRNHHTRAETIADNGWTRLRSWSIGLAVLGLLVMSFAFVMREVVAVEGVLRGEGLFAVRARDQARPVQVAELGRVEADTPLVEFASTQSLNDREGLELKRAHLQAERESLVLQPLPLDSELVRRHQNALITERDRRATLDQFLGTATSAERDLFDQIFKKQQSIIQVRGDIAVARKKLEHSQQKLLLASKQLVRDRGMLMQGYASSLEVEERSKEVQTLSSEVSELRNRSTASEAELRQIEESLANLQVLARRQNTDLAMEMDRLRMAVASSVAEVEEQKQALDKEKQLAGQRREKDLAQLDWKLRQADALLGGITRTQEVLAPFPGWIVYRAASPGVAKEHGILAVLSPEKNFRFLAKVSSAQVESLRTAGDVTLDAGEGNLLRRFSGQFLRSMPIDGEPTTALVELECRPTAEVIESLLENNKVRAKFIWQPPLFSLWPFNLGFILVVVSLFGRTLCFLFVGSSRNEPSPMTPPPPIRTPSAAVPWAIEISEAEPSVHPASDSVADIGIMPEIPHPTADTIIAQGTKADLDLAAVDAGNAGEIVEMLAIQLREAIAHEDISIDTVAAAEWMLDRHHARAVRIFRSIFRQDRSYLAHLDALPRTAIGREPSLHARVIRILEAAGACPTQMELFPSGLLPSALMME